MVGKGVAMDTGAVGTLGHTSYATGAFIRAPTEESGAPPPRRAAASRRGMRSRNAFIDSELASGQYADSFADLEDFIVCKRGRQY